MTESKSTRLRFISGGSPEEITQAVSSLQFMVEIKGAPVFQGSRWYLFFVIPSVIADFENVDL